MSHFTVAVFTKTGFEEEIERLLAPYDEQNEDYFEFETDEDGDEIEGHEEKGWLYNPNAKWDWWEIGGRWYGLLKLLPGKTGKCGQRSWTNKDKPEEPGHCNSARVCDVDFSMDEDKFKKALRFWELYVDGEPLRPGEEMPDTWYRREYFIEQFGDKETYALSRAEFGTYAFVSSDGKWHGEARMGWWGMDDNTREKREAQRFDMVQYVHDHPDEYITIVDCHI